MAGALINSPAITGPGDSLQQFEDPIELMQAKRKQEIALALLKQLQGGPPQPQQTRILAKTPLMATLLHAGSQGMAASRLAEADAQIGEIAKQEQQAYSQGAGELMGSQDQRAAIAKAMASNHPRLRALAAAQEKARRDAEEKALDRKRALVEKGMGLLGEVGATKQGLAAGASGELDPNVELPKPVAPEFGTRTVDGRQVPVVVNTDPKTNKQTGSFGQGGINITNGNERQLNKVVGDLTGDSLKENLAAAKSAHALNNTLSQLESLSQDGIVSGPATKPLEWIAGLGHAAGVPIDAKKLGNTQAFNASAEQAVQAMIAGMAGGNRGITKEESERIMGMLPMAAQSPEARAQITAELRRINQRRIDGFSEQAKAVEQAMRTGQYGSLEELLIPPSLGVGKPPTAPAPGPRAVSPAPAAAPGALPGGQTPEVMAERIKIVKAEFDRETDPATKAALGRELQRLQQGMGGATPAPASADRFKGFSIVR